VGRASDLAGVWGSAPRKEDEIKLPVETKLNFKLASPIEVTRPAEAKEAKTSRPAA
jgi:hypothetical protein